MKKVMRFTHMTVVIPLEDGKTEEEVEERLVDAVESAGSRFTTYRIETEEEEEDE